VSEFSAALDFFIEEYRNLHYFMLGQRFGNCFEAELCKLQLHVLMHDMIKSLYTSAVKK